MLIIHTADLHLGTTTYGELDASTGMSKRISDYFDSFDKIIDYSILNKADVFLICGDTFKDSTPTPTILKMFASRLKKLTKNEIKIVMISGNHDLPKTEAKSSPIEIYAEIGMENFYYLDKKSFIDIITKDGKKLRIFALPYIHPVRALISQQNLKKKGELTYEEVVKAYREECKDCVRNFEKIGKDDVDLCILMSHLCVAGASKGSEETPILLGGEFSVFPTLFHNNLFDYVALGHIHKYQCLDGKIPIVYSGSIERSDFSETNEKKGFVAINFDQKISWKFIEIPTRKMVKLEVDGTGIKIINEEILKLISSIDVKDAIVKLLIKISKKSRPIIDYSEVKRILKDAFYVEPSYERIEEKTDIQTIFSESLTPMDSLRKFIELLTDIPIKDKKIIENLGLKIIKEVESEALE